MDRENLKKALVLQSLTLSIAAVAIAIVVLLTK